MPSTNITTATTTTIKTGIGVLEKIIINKRATAAGTLKMFDNTAGSGAVIGDFDWGSALLMPSSIQMDLAFSVGLTVVSTSANPGDATFIWR